MKDSLPSQIDVGTTEFCYPNKELSLKKRGRKAIITSDKWLDAVNKIQTMNDKEIAKELKVSKTTVWRFRNNIKNIDVIN